MFSCLCGTRVCLWSKVLQNSISFNGSIYYDVYVEGVNQEHKWHGINKWVHTWWKFCFIYFDYFSEHILWTKHEQNAHAAGFAPLLLGTSNLFALLVCCAALSYFMLIKFVALFCCNLKPITQDVSGRAHTDSQLCCLIPSTLTPGCSSLLRYLVLTCCAGGKRRKIVENRGIAWRWGRALQAVK